MPSQRPYSCEMRPLRYSINVTLDGCCDHRAMLADEDLHRHAVENLDQADALLFGRATYEMMRQRSGPPRGAERGPVGITLRKEDRRAKLSEGWLAPNDVNDLCRSRRLATLAAAL